jgi:DNA-binding transcriptional LysR family regulator
MPPSQLRRFFRHGLFPQLMAFEACVRLGSVTRAADELSLAQPTVSGMLRKLSDTLGAPVIAMRDRRVQPTAAGLELLALVEELLHAFGRFEQRRAAGPARYDRLPANAPDESSPWPSSYRSASPSRWKPRASPCPPARPRPPRAAGGS